MSREKSTELDKASKTKGRPDMFNDKAKHKTPQRALGFSLASFKASKTSLFVKTRNHIYTLEHRIKLLEDENKDNMRVSRDCKIPDGKPEGIVPPEARKLATLQPSQAIITKSMYIRLAFSIYLIVVIAVISYYLKSKTRKIEPTGSANKVPEGVHHKLIEKCSVKFKDVRGCDDVKVQMEKIVKFLKDPTDFIRFGAKMPRGYLLTGPPGVGKTLLAKAVAGESGVPFLTISGAGFEEVFIGVGAQRVRKLFEDARAYGKAVIFIDEIDSVAGKRSEGMIGDVKRQTLNQILVEMDGFESEDGIIVLAATNTPETLDPAILRPGRFDKTFALSPPDINGRAELLKELMSSIPADKREDGDMKNLEFMWLSRITVSYTGADLANLVNHAKMIASVEDGATVITKKHMIEAKEFVDIGPKRDFELTPEDKERTAYHEAGHAIVALVNEGAFSVQHATIIPHGQFLGLVTSVPETDIRHMSFKMLKDRMDMYLGGFVAERIRYNHIDQVSTAASSDFKFVNSFAKTIIEAGFGTRSKFLLPSENSSNSSESAKKDFEDDMKDVMNEAERRVEKLIKKEVQAWRELAKALIAKDSLNREEIRKIYDEHKSA